MGDQILRYPDLFWYTTVHEIISDMQPVVLGNDLSGAWFLLPPYL